MVNCTADKQRVIVINLQSTSKQEPYIHFKQKQTLANEFTTLTKIRETQIKQNLTKSKSQLNANRWRRTKTF